MAKASAVRAGNVTASHPTRPSTDSQGLNADVTAVNRAAFRLRVSSIERSPVPVAAIQSQQPDGGLAVQAPGPAIVNRMELYVSSGLTGIGDARSGKEFG